jgi:hypothetical protein
MNINFKYPSSCIALLVVVCQYLCWTSQLVDVQAQQGPTISPESDCFAGTYQATNSSVCSVCTAGSYALENATSCTSCPYASPDYEGAASCNRWKMEHLGVSLNDNYYGEYYYADINAIAFNGSLIYFTSYQGVVGMLDTDTGLLSDYYQFPELEGGPESIEGIAVFGSMVYVFDLSEDEIVALQSSEVNTTISGLIFNPKGLLTGDASGNLYFPYTNDQFSSYSIHRVNLTNHGEATFCSSSSAVTALVVYENMLYYVNGQGIFSVNISSSNSTTTLFEYSVISSFGDFSSFAVIPGGNMVMAAEAGIYYLNSAGNFTQISNITLQSIVLGDDNRIYAGGAFNEFFSGGLVNISGQCSFHFCEIVSTALIGCRRLVGLCNPGYYFTTTATCQPVPKGIVELFLGIPTAITAFLLQASTIRSLGPCTTHVPATILLVSALATTFPPLPQRRCHSRRCLPFKSPVSHRVRPTCPYRWSLRSPVISVDSFIALYKDPS